MEKYTCAACHETYEKTGKWDDIDAKAEYLSLYPECRDDEFDVVCDDCYKQIRAWLSKLTPEEKKKMRDDYNNSK